MTGGYIMVEAGESPRLSSHPRRGWHMHIGFTGTRQGMTERQFDRVASLLYRLWQDEGAHTVHHGDCVGADEEFHQIAMDFGLHTVIHPPTDPEHRAFCDADEAREPKPYLERNTDIVLASDKLIATPKEMNEVLRSGTWATIRRARTHDTAHIIIRPRRT